MAAYTLRYHAIATNVSRTRLGVAMVAPQIDASVLSTLALGVTSDDATSEGAFGVVRTLVLAPTGTGVLPLDQIPAALANILTGQISQAIASPVVADPVVGP